MAEKPPSSPHEKTSLVWLVPDTQFKPLVIPKKTQSQPLHGYRIYRSSSDYVDIQATTLAEALEHCAVDAPIKVERLGVISPTIYPAGTLQAISGYQGDNKMAHLMTPPTATS